MDLGYNYSVTVATDSQSPADVCTKALPGNRIREQCPLARVYVCDDPDEWCLSRLEELCQGEKFEQSCDAESEGAC